MKKIVLTLLTITALSFPTVATGFTPFAPIAEVPANPENTPAMSLVAKHISAATILENEEVGLPAYLGAQIVQTNSAQDQTLPSVILVSADPVEQIASFYKSQLPEWSYQRIDNQHLFWQGLLEKAQQGQTPAISIGLAQLYKGISSAQSEITIWYNP